MLIPEYPGKKNQQRWKIYFNFLASLPKKRELPGKANWGFPQTLAHKTDNRINNFILVHHRVYATWCFLFTHEKIKIKIAFQFRSCWYARCWEESEMKFVVEPSTRSFLSSRLRWCCEKKNNKVFVGKVYFYV